MRVDSTLRVMWLLNHTSARNFELHILKTLGVAEIYTPKSYPQEAAFRSASISFDTDSGLSIPERELAVLNEQNWYETPSKIAWEIANKYFDILFFILYKPEVISNIAGNFEGAILWRAFGLVAGNTHAKLATSLSPNLASYCLKRLGNRLWFAQAYNHLHEVESPILANRKIDLPLGMLDTEVRQGWIGTDTRIYFVCADLETNVYYKQVYDYFYESFGDLPHVIAGAQAIDPDVSGVLGYVSNEEHMKNMREFRLMFYHSQEPRHIHYHPFEAIRAGMPLIFMAGGMLDRMGGLALPGRCKTIKEARAKIQRLLDGDVALIESIRSSQSVLLEAMCFEKLLPAWREGFERVRCELEISRQETSLRRATTKQKRIAVIVPAGYRGGSLRGAKLLAQAIHVGSRQFGEAVDVVLLHLDDADTYPDEEFADLPKEIKLRPFRWKSLTASEARRAMRYAGHPDWVPLKHEYAVIDDGIKQLEDCAIWLVVSDRLNMELLPLRPVVHMIYDYLQRYVPILPGGADQPFLDVARSAKRVFVTTDFTYKDTVQYAGVSPDRVVKLPMLAPDFTGEDIAKLGDSPNYFVWTTNAARHKNHANALNALNALKLYYEELDGTLDCIITGVNTAKLFSSPPDHLMDVMGRIRNSKRVCKRLKCKGGLPDQDYRRLLAGAAFLWHAGRIDNGTFSVIEAASLGVPALSSDYPAMREINEQFSLNLAWMNADDPEAMARALKNIEINGHSLRNDLPTADQLELQSIECLAGSYWKAVRECM